MNKQSIGNCTLYLGDCLEILPTLDKVDAIVTDPPYGISYKSPMTTHHNELQNDGFEDFTICLPKWFSAMSNLLSEEGVICCCCGGGGKTPVTAIATIEFTKYWQLIQTLIWDKKTIGLGWKYRPSYETILVGAKDRDNFKWHTDSAKVSNILRFNNVIPQKGDHPTGKPIPLIQNLLSYHTIVNDLVLDPFMGGGTTGVACAKMGRKFIGIEIEPKYFDIACKRIEDAYKQGDLFITNK